MSLKNTNNFWELRCDLCGLLIKRKTHKEAVKASKDYHWWNIHSDDFRCWFNYCPKCGPTGKKMIIG